MPKFVLPESMNKQERVVINGRYVFVNGEMPCNKNDVLKLEKILSRFYGCTIVHDSEKQAEAPKKDDSSLKSEATKQGADKK